MELKGTIIEVLQPMSGVSQRGTGWMKQEYVIQIDDNSQYPKKCCFYVFGEDRIKEFDLHVNDYCRFHIDVNAREYKGRWYNDLGCYRVDKDVISTSTPQQQTPQQAAPSVTPPFPPQQTSAVPNAQPIAEQPQQKAEEKPVPSDDLPF